MVMLSSVIVASLDPTQSFRGGVVAVEPVIVNAELDKERAVFGVELVPEQVKVIHVGQHGRKGSRRAQVSYGRKPTGRGAAAGRLSPPPQAGSPVRNAPTMTAPAELAGLPISRRACSRRGSHSPADRPSRRAAVSARIGGGFAACTYRVRRALSGSAPPESRAPEDRF